MNMKKIVSICVAVILAFSLLSAFVMADVERHESVFTKVDTAKNKVIYNVPDAEAGGYGQPWYDDDEGQQKLLDGVIPTTADLETAKAEKEEQIEGINYWAWEGWIALAKTKNAFVENQKVNVDFEFEKEFILEELAVYSCAMEKGSVGTPTAVSVYISDDGSNYTKSPVGTCEGSGTFGVYLQECSVVTLETPVKTRFVRIVMDCSQAAWVFLSEVEFFEDKLEENYLTYADIESEQETENSVEESSEPDVISVESSQEISIQESSKVQSSADDTAGSKAWNVSDSEDDGSNSILIICVVIGIVVAAGVVAAIFISKKKKAE